MKVGSNGSHLKQEKKSRTAPRGKCCLGLHCMGLSSSTMSPTTYQQACKLADLERELKRQIEQKDMYRAKLERMEDCLRYCLKTAQDNGLDLIANNPHYSDFFPGLRPSSTANPQLSTIISQAKINGWYIEPHEIERHEQVGRGSTAIIYRGTWRGIDVAVKCIHPNLFRSSENSGMWFVQELATLSRQRHPFVLRLMGACLDPPENAWVITEFLSGRTLKEWLHGQGDRNEERSTPLPPLEERMEKGIEIAQAMQFLHEQRPRLVHRDLKPSNVFIDGAMHVRVADFGHARFLNEGEQAYTGETGTYVYMAPEVIRCEPYDEKCDVYSFGVILNELLTGHYPYVDTDYLPAEIALAVGEGKLRPTLPTDDDGRLRELLGLIRHSWDEDPSIRPSFATITCTLKKIKEQLDEQLNPVSKA